ncbi:MAG TPA: M20/M25/M40 family metallo-hydrolase [Candidatus Lokiarchaeia archaeon]|nr:M20/M25/M40 family metallo-hydrolase [Candidatus Lokiarchaeia archaeon]
MTGLVDVDTLARDLVSIPSDPPAHLEGDLINWLREMFESRGLCCINQPTGLGKFRENLLVLSHDPGDAPSDLDGRGGLLFSAHADVVPPGYADAFDPWVDGAGFLHGRGATDMKGGMAAFIAAFLNNLDAITSRTDKLIGMLFTVDEEITLTGAKVFASSEYAGLFKNAILPEPTSMQPVRGHKGVMFVRYDVHGKSAHAAMPELGINAITIAMDLYYAIENGLSTVFAERVHPVLGPPTFNIGAMHGGERANIVPGSCYFLFDRRITGGETVEDSIAELDNIARSIHLPDGASITSQVIHAEEPYCLEDVDPFLKHVCDMIGVEPSIMNGYTEAGIYYNKAGISTIILGPGGIEGAHVIDEKVSTQELRDATAVYEKLMLDYINNDEQAWIVARKIKKLAIFDMDGTLVNFAIDSNAVRSDAIKYLIETLSIPDDLLDVSYPTTELMAKTKAYLQQENRDEPDWNEIRAVVYKIAELYEDKAAEVSTPIAGIENVLADLEGSGVIMAVCTFNSTRNALNVLKRNGIDQFFSSVVGRDKVPDKTKPNPAHGQYILEELGFNPEQACMIGDHPNDIQMAVALGIKGIAITSERHGASDFARFEDCLSAIVGDNEYDLLASAIKHALDIS